MAEEELKSLLKVKEESEIVGLKFNIQKTKIMPSIPYPLLSPSPPAFNLSQHQSLSQRVSSLHQVAKVLE